MEGLERLSTMKDIFGAADSDSSEKRQNDECLQGQQEAATRPGPESGSHHLPAASVDPLTQEGLQLKCQVPGSILLLDVSSQFEQTDGTQNPHQSWSLTVGFKISFFLRCISVI